MLWPSGLFWPWAFLAFLAFIVVVNSISTGKILWNPSIITVLYILYYTAYCDFSFSFLFFAKNGFENNSTVHY